MASRKVRGRLKSLPRAHRKKKNDHNERTNRKGKMWAAQHVEQDKIKELQGAKFRERAARRRLEKLGVELPEDKGK